ncbi:MAG: DUF2809 domain-containing protein [Micrococcales bacterium]|nr:DUF2809 domain-containing protein [Micrococcales bacterium]
MTRPDARDAPVATAGPAAPAGSAAPPAGTAAPAAPHVPDRVPRRGVALAVGPVVAAGLVTARVGSGAAADVLGDALYAVLVLLLVSLTAPRWSLRRRAVAAVVLCWVVEVAQATGGPALLVDRWGPAAFVVGTTFAWRDLAVYAAGVGLAVLVMAACSQVGSGSVRPAVPRP